MDWHTPICEELEELWKPVVGYEGLYEVSNYGRVESLPRKVQYLGRRGLWTVKERILKTRVGSGGYLVVGLANKRTWRVPIHILVLTAFDKPRSVGQQAQHLNGNASDSRLCNLRWGTPGENREDMRVHGTTNRGERNGRVKLTKWDVLIEIPCYSALGLNYTQMAKRLGVVGSTIRGILLGWYWPHLYCEPPPVVTQETSRKYIGEIK